MNAPRGSQSTCGFTLIELLFVIGIIAILVALMLPAVRVSREAARETECKNQLRNIGLALHTYHTSNDHFPSAMGGTGVGASASDGNSNRLSGMVALLPYLEKQKLWEQIVKPATIDGTTYPAMGPAPWVLEYEPWRLQVDGLQCPSAVQEPTDLGRTSYAFCIGDMARQIHQPNVLRGVFGCGMLSRLKDITDGTSQTIAMAEICTPVERYVPGQFATGQPTNVLDDPSLCDRVRDANDPTGYAQDIALGSPGRGGRWADGAACYSLVNTILPPNSPSCAVEGAEAVDGIYSAGSAHRKGANVLKVDGSIAFINDTIDAGDSHHPAPSPAQMASESFASPYGVWGALGTAAAADKAE